MWFIGALVGGNEEVALWAASPGALLVAGLAFAFLKQVGNPK